jgi:hypothetical protein
MRFLGVHPGPLMYTKVFLRLEPLGLELVAAAVRAKGHEVRVIDLQVASHRDFHRMVARWRPEIIAFSCNYLANVPEIVDLAKAVKRTQPGCFILVGGHSASFTARAILEHGAGAIDGVATGEGEAGIPMLLEALTTRLLLRGQTISRRACSSSTASTIPRCCSPTMPGRSPTKFRCRPPRKQVSSATGSSFTASPAAPIIRSTPRPSASSPNRRADQRPSYSADTSLPV